MQPRADILCQDLIAGFGIAFYERNLVSVLLLYSLVYAILYIIRERVVIGSTWQEALSLAFSSSSVIALVLAVSAHILRLVAVTRAWKLVIADKERYDIMWKSMLNSAESRETLTAIQQEVYLHHLSRVNSLICNI